MAQPPVNLGTATSFAVLAGTTITNTGSTVITGDIGVYPGTAITDFPPGIIIGTTHAGDPVAQQAEIDLGIAYIDAAGRTADASVPASDIGGYTLNPGVYNASSSLGITGTLTLDAQGDPNAVFIFQIGSALNTAAEDSNVVLINGAQACNVFWQVTSSATLGTHTIFQGTILALTSIAATTGAVVIGRLLARNGAVTLDTNTITATICAVPLRGIPLW